MASSTSMRGVEGAGQGRVLDRPARRGSSATARIFSARRSSALGDADRGGVSSCVVAQRHGVVGRVHHHHGGLGHVLHHPAGASSCMRSCFCRAFDVRVALGLLVVLLHLLAGHAHARHEALALTRTSRRPAMTAMTIRHRHGQGAHDVGRQRQDRRRLSGPAARRSWRRGASAPSRSTALDGDDLGQAT